jgi:hypothetical protein
MVAPTLRTLSANMNLHEFPYTYCMYIYTNILLLGHGFFPRRWLCCAILTDDEAYTVYVASPSLTRNEHGALTHFYALTYYVNKHLL